MSPTIAIRTVSRAHHLSEQTCGRGAGQSASRHDAVLGLGEQEGYAAIHQLLWWRGASMAGICFDTAVSY